MDICNVEAKKNVLNQASALRLKPGSADESMVYLRMTRRDLHAMPPLGSYAVDTEGAVLIKAWIDGLSSCSN